MQVILDAGYLPVTFNSFKEIKSLPVYQKNYSETWTNTKVSNPDWKSNFPVDDVIYFWDQPYFYYGRSRKDSDGNVPRSYETAHFRSPVTIRTMAADKPFEGNKAMWLQLFTGGSNGIPPYPVYTNKSNTMKSP